MEDLPTSRSDHPHGLHRPVSGGAQSEDDSDKYSRLSPAVPIAGLELMDRVHRFDCARLKPPQARQWPLGRHPATLPLTSR
jgi:hypothetical protein